MNSVGLSAVAVFLVTTLSAQSWSRVATTGPTARDTHATAFDPSSGKIVMFGGYSTGGAGRLSDTWAWDGKAWRKVSTSTQPLARETHAMASDGNGILLFGGRVCCRVLGDTWLFKTGKWTKLSPSKSPPARRYHDMASTSTGAILFGGSDHDGKTPMNDTWEWDRTKWVQRSPSRSPSARFIAGLAYDSHRKRVVLFGGKDASMKRLNDTWEWDGADWTRMTPPVSPPPREGHSLTYDGASKRIILYGGLASSVLTDTWAWDGKNWVRVPTTVNPGSRWEFSMEFDLRRNEVVLFGGRTTKGSVGDTWVLPPKVPGRYAVFGKGCAGSATPPALRAPAPPTLGKPFSLEVSNLKALTGGVIVIGNSNSSPYPLDLAFMGMAGCKLLTNWLLQVGIFTSHGGTAKWSVNLPTDPSLLSSVFYNQAWVLDSAANSTGIATSNGGHGVIGR